MYTLYSEVKPNTNLNQVKPNQEKILSNTKSYIQLCLTNTFLLGECKSSARFWIGKFAVELT